MGIVDASIFLVICRVWRIPSYDPGVGKVFRAIRSDGESDEKSIDEAQNRIYSLVYSTRGRYIYSARSSGRGQQIFLESFTSAFDVDENTANEGTRIRETITVLQCRIVALSLETREKNA